MLEVLLVFRKLFKKKLNVYDAAGFYIKNLAVIIHNTWSDDLQTINQYLNQPLTDKNDQLSFELFLAVLSLEMNVIKNKIPDKYDVIYQAILDILSQDNIYGDYSIETITKEYIPSIEISESENLPPFDRILYILADKLGIDPSPVIGGFLIEILVGKLGLWNKIIDEYKIVS